MEQKIKFIIIGLVGFCIVCLFLFIQATSQQQGLLRESNDLKTENTVLLNRANKFENDLKETQSKVGSLKAERDKGIEELNELQKKFELASRARDELIEKLKKNSQPQVVVTASPSVQQQAPVPENTDAYWGTVLKAKTDLEMQLSSIRLELRNLQINNESLQREKSALEIDINSLRSDKKDLLRQLDYNQKLLDSMSQEVVREKNDKVAIQDSFRTVRAQNGILSRQLKSLVSRKEALDKKVISLQEGKTTVEKRLNEMETMFTDRISKMGSLKNELDEIKSSKAEDTEKVSKESVELPAIVVRSSPAAGREEAEVLTFPGKILAVNLDSNFVVIDLGSSAGVSVGNVFNVYRNARSIGSISVIQTRVNISACDIKRMSTSLKIGDSIK
jgi:chromosome segregation ATPase